MFVSALLHLLVLSFLRLVMQLPLHRITGHNVWSVAHGHVHFRLHVGWLVVGKQGSTGGLTELAYHPLKKPVGLMLCPVGEDADNAFPMAVVLQ